MRDKLTFGQKLEIEKYVNIEEGFKDIRPDLCVASNDPTVSFLVSQLTFHREKLQQWLEDNVEWDDELPL